MNKKNAIIVIAQYQENMGSEMENSDINAVLATGILQVVII